jgi:imidazolonepropionase-like amidohydrolase
MLRREEPTSVLKRKSFFALACALFIATTLWAARSNAARSFDGEAYAIRGGTVVTVSGATIQKGTVVIRNGLIEAVGADIPVPADARVIDAMGMMVYPGLFDAYTSYGLRPAPTPAPPPPGADPMQMLIAQFTAPQSNAGLLPETSVVDQLQIGAETFDNQRAAGITTALTGLRSGVFQGQSALINLGSDAAEKLIIKAPVSLNIGFGSARGGYPQSLMGVFSFLRQSLLDAQRYRDEWARYNKAPRGAERPQVNKSSAALQPIINSEIPVIFNVSTAREMHRAIALAEEFKLKYMIAGATQSYQIADHLKAKNATVLLSLSFPQKPANQDDPEAEALRVLRERAEAPKAAAALHRAGVRFAFTSGTLLRPADFLVNAARAVEAGLPKEEALKALTIRPAEIFGVSEQLGSIEKGKIANLILTSGDLFDRNTRVRHVFVDGKRFDVRAPEPPRRGPGTVAADATTSAGAGSGGIAAGAWALTINSPRGTMQLTLNLQQNGTALTGSINLPFGAAPITRGNLSGTEIELEFTITPPNGQATNGVLRGKIDGSTLTGQVDMMGRTSEFTGTKTPRQ